MILHVKKYTPLYQQLGVFTEAPRRARRKPRVIQGNAPSTLTDYTAGAESEEELNLDDMDLDDTEDGDTDDLTTGSDDDGEEELQTDDPGAPANDGEDLTAGADDDAGGDTPDTGGGEGNADELVTDDGGDAGGTDGDGDDEPATDDDSGEDLTAGADDDDSGGGEEDGGEGSSSDEGGEGKKNFKREDMKRFILFKSMNSLHTSLDNYISKLSTVDANNTVLGHAYREIKTAFQELQSLLYDYMLLKFSSDSYASAVYFYEQLKAAVLILFSLLQEAKEKVKDEGKTPSRRPKT